LKNKKLHAGMNDEEIENNLQQLRYYILTYQQEKKETEYLSKIVKNKQTKEKKEKQEKQEK